MSSGDDPTAVDRPRPNRVRAEPDAVAATELNERVSRPGISDLPQLTTVDPLHYVIGPELARGGMGRIHAARDRRLGRDVAIKELLVESEALANRFEREARITARLQHPSIVSVHEAGRWPNGNPFYAMKLVSGQSLLEAIRKTSTFEERIAFVPNILAIADAMAYAHSQRVPHRDLKPNNVILGEFGETVVIDWGIAKSLDDPDDPTTPLAAPGDVRGQTEIGAVLGTPGYMSPEQAFGENVDERSDVFAIGVILYQALTGKMPWRDDTLMLAAMASGPPRLADVVPSIPPDLAAIAERALAPKLDVRYRDARELADDLRRFTTGQLVGAHRYSTRDLIARWLRRHRTAVVVATIATVVLATVGIISVRSVVHERHIAQEQRARAEQRSADAEDAMSFMLFEVAEKLRQAGRLELMDTVVRRALDYYSRITDRDIDPTRLVSALKVIGDVLRTKGDLAAAAVEYERAKRIAEARVQDGPLWQHLLGAAFNDLGQTSYQQGNLQDAVAFHSRALAISEALVANDPSDPRWQKDLAASQRLTATVLQDQGLINDALAYLQASFAITKRLADASKDQSALRDLMISHTDLGLAYARGKDSSAALPDLRAALALAKQQADADPLGTTWQRDVAVAHERLGAVLVMRGDQTGALEEYQRGLAAMQEVAALDSANADWQRRLSIMYERVGSTLLELGRADEALQALQTSGEIRRRLVKRDPSNARWQRDLSHGLIEIGDALLARGDAAGALVQYRTANEIRDRLVAKDPTSVKWQSDIFSARRRIGNALFATGDIVGSRVELEAAAEVATEVLARDPSAVDDADRVDLHATLAQVLRAAGDKVKATQQLEFAITLARTRAEREPTDPKRTERLKSLEAQRAPLGGR